MTKKILGSLLATLFFVGASMSVMATSERLESEIKKELNDGKTKNKKNKGNKGCRGVSDDHISDRGAEMRNSGNCNNSGNIFDDDSKGKDKKNREDKYDDNSKGKGKKDKNKK